MKQSPLHHTLVIGLVLLVLLANTSVVAGDWQLLWSDEFENGMLDNTFWTPRIGFLGYNSEFQTYTDHPENIRVQGGKLQMSAVRDINAQVGYTSGRIESMNKVQIKYATVEASIKIPDMKLGLWPAFWTLGQDFAQGVGWPQAGELDIMEMGQKLGGSLGLGNRRVITAIHWDANGYYVLQDGFLDVPYDLSQDFHTYKMEWQPDAVAMYVDDTLIASYEIASCISVCPELHQFQFLVLNVAVAGQFTCCEYGFELNDYPNGTAWTMEVDYVRVYGNEHTEIILPAGITTAAPGTTITPSPTSLTTPQPTAPPMTTSLPTLVATNLNTNTTAPQNSTTNAPAATPATNPPTVTPATNPPLPVVATGSPTAGPTTTSPVATMNPTILSTANTAVDTTSTVPRATDPPSTLMPPTSEPSSIVVEASEASPTSEPTTTLELLENLLLGDGAPSAAPSADSSILPEGATSTPTTEMESAATASPTGDGANNGNATLSQVISSGLSCFHSFRQFQVTIGVTATIALLLLL